MTERVELTRRKAYGIDPLGPAPYTTFDRYDSRISRHTEPYEYTLRFGENYCRVVEDWHMMDMRMSMTEAEYNRYLTDRLTNEMLGHLRGQIKSGLSRQAADNAPKSDNMAYLFKN